MRLVQILDMHLLSSILLVLALFVLPLCACSVENFRLVEQSWTTVYVEPAKATVFLYTTFRANVSVKVLDLDLYSYQFDLCFSNRLLKIVDFVLPKDHFLTPEDPRNIQIVELEANQTGGYAFIAVTLMNGERGKVGNGTLATVTFRAEEAGSSNITLRDYLFVSSESGPPEAFSVAVLDGLVDVVVPDLNKDGKVDIADISIVATAFDSKPGTLKWNHIADLNQDEIVNILDIGVVAKSFGQISTT